MTNSPDSGPEPRPGSSQRPWLRRLRRIGLPLGGAFLVITAAGVWWGWVFVHERLAPLVETNLSETLKRPVKLGRVERFSLTSLRFGRSSIPATPTDPDKASVEAVEVNFDPLRILLTRDLNLNITLVKPDLYLEQAKDGTWISTQIEEKEETGPIKTELQKIRFQDARIVLVPAGKYGGHAKAVQLVSTSGSAQFLDQNQRITYELAGQSVTGGQLNLMGETLRSPQQTNLQVRGQNFLVSEIDRLVKLPVDLQAGRGSGVVDVQIRPDQKVPDINGTARFEGVALKIPQVPQSFNQAKGGLQLQGTRIRLENVSARYGKVPLVANGELDTEKGFNLAAQVKPTKLPTVLETLKIPLPFPVAGEVAADLKVTGPTQSPALSGVARSTQASRFDRLEVSRFSGRFQLDTKASVLLVSDVRATPTVGGSVTGTGQVNLKDRPQVAFNVQVADVPTDPIVRAYGVTNLPAVALGPINAQLRLVGPADALTVLIPSARVTPQAGGVVTASGQIQLQNQPTLSLIAKAENVPGDAIARAYNGGNAVPITVGRVNAQAQISGLASNPSAQVRWQAPEATYAGSGTILLANQVINLRDTVLNVAGGTVNAQAQVVAGRWQAQATGSQIQLSRFSPDLRGLFSGQFVASGNINSFRPADIRAQGQARFSQGIAVVNQPLTAQVQWDGQKLLVQRATAPGLEANGAIFAQLEGAGAPAITGLDLNVQARDYSLQAFSIPLPVAVQYSGRADFTGRVTGTPADPRVAGDLALRDFVLNDVAFDSVMRGRVQVAKGVNLNLEGVRDRIAVTLNSEYRPVAFDVQRGEAIAQGRTQGGLLVVNARKFPLAFLSPPGLAALFPVSGELNGQVAVDLQRQSVAGELTVDRPAIGTFRADRFGGRISFANGVASLAGAELRQCPQDFNQKQRDCTTVAINGSATLFGPAAPQVKGTVVANGYLQDVLQLAQFFDIQDFARGVQLPAYGSASDLAAVPADFSNTTVLNQLRRLAEVQTLLADIRAQRKASPLPELRELEGKFTAKITADGSLKSGINLGFDVEGQNWQWGQYSAKQVVAIGSFRNGVVELVPLRFQSDNALVAFSGQIGGPNQSGQLRVENLPIDSITALFPSMPLKLEGQLNATATLAGSQENPQAVGELSVTDGVLNGTAIQQAQGTFNYGNARLQFGTNLVISGPQPLVVTGSIPYQLPFAAVAPANKDIRLDINVKNEGLALLNLLNNQVAWVENDKQKGTGQVNLQVRGTLEQPIATGTIDVTNATLQARALPEPLTGVTGVIRFDRDRLRVENLRGDFSQGQVTAQGALPIFARFAPQDADQANPLTVDLNKLRLRLKGLYQGGVDGNVQVTGTALNPVLGGVIRLSKGEVQLADADTATPAAASPGATPGAGVQPESGSNVEFSNLQIQLNDNVRVTRQPIINFVAAGNLTINGSLSDLRPSGTINLKSGQVNLFTTQFNLAKGYPQTATFDPNQGLDPVLNVRMIASVPEATGSRMPTSILPSEILDTPTPVSQLGGLQTVRVQARVQGLASQLYENLELTSSPARSPAEIVALIGGGFVATLGRGDSALGIANLAGSALLTNIQTTIGNAIGLSEFRLFPTLTREDRARESSNTSSTLGLAAEASIDITPSISFSVLRLLTANQPTQFGLRYRLNDQLLLRGSTDFSGDDRAVIEYESRF